MSIIGGYFSDSATKADAGELKRKVQAFQIPSAGDSKNNEVSLYEYEYGHLFIQQRKNVRSLISAFSDDKGLFVSLGYLTMQNWDDWDGDRGCLRIPHQRPDDFAENLKRAEGEYVSLYVRKGAGELHLVNDRFASRPFYYLKTPDGLWFCSNLFLLLKMAGTPIRLDPVGLLQTFHFSHTIDTRTHIRSVCRLQPASHVKVSPKTIHHSRYWKPQYHVQDDLNPDAFAQDVFSAFQEGVAQRTRWIKQGFLALSGGLDSRLIAACLPNAAAFPAVTFLPDRADPNPEYEIAHSVADVLGMTHRPLPMVPGDISRYARDLTMLVGGGGQMNHFVKAMRAPYAEYDIFLGGGPGDVLIGSHIPNLYYTLASRTKSLIDAHTRIWSSALMSLFFPTDMVKSAIPEIEKTLRESFEYVAGPTAAHTLSAWKMVYRQPAFTFCHLSCSHPLSTQIHPHLAYAYNDLILQLPAAWLYQRQFYKYMIYRCLPQLRSVPYANTGKALDGKIGPTRLPIWYYKWWAAKRRFRDGMQRLIPGPSANQSFESYLVQKDSQFFKDMREILSSYHELKDYFNVSEWMKCMDAVETNTASQSHLRNPEDALGFLAGILYLYRYYYE